MKPILIIFLRIEKMKQNKILANIYLCSIFATLLAYMGTALAEFKVVEARSCVNKKSPQDGTVFSWKYYLGTKKDKDNRYADTSLGRVNLSDNPKGRFEFTDDYINAMYGMEYFVRENNYHASYDAYWRLDHLRDDLYTLKYGETKLSSEKKPTEFVKFELECKPDSEPSCETIMSLTVDGCLLARPYNPETDSGDPSADVGTCNVKKVDIPHKSVCKSDQK
jgi:hypothetical protein